MSGTQAAKPKPDYIACECGERSLPIEQMSCTEDGAWVCRECCTVCGEPAGDVADFLRKEFPNG